MLEPELIDYEISLRKLRGSELPVVFRNGLSTMTMEEWRCFLKNTCNFVEDKRHFDVNGELNNRDWWEISYQPDKASSYAHSNTLQPLHTDNAWFQNPSEINFFVMWKQATSGGAQLILPLTRLLEALSNEQPTLLNDLASIPVVIKKGDGLYENKTTIITLGERPRIYWNFYRTIKSSTQVTDMCNAFFTYLESILTSNIVEKLYCETGDCFAFNDTFLLHGRDSFTAKYHKERVLYQSMWKFPTD
jgi:hypothetical protein